MQNTQDIINKLKDIKITKMMRFVSFDIKDLYTSIPTQETLIILRKKLTNSYEYQYNNEIMDIAKTILKQNYFRFSGNIYKLPDRLDLGNPTSATFAEIFLQRIEEVHSKTLMRKHNIS